MLNFINNKLTRALQAHHAIWHTLNLWCGVGDHFGLETGF